MAQYQDNIPSIQSWIHDLAKAEMHPDAQKLFDQGNRLDPQNVIEESTIEYLNRLRERFSEYARTFNSYSEQGKKFSEVKIYSIAQTAADFMLYRNHVKLVVSNPFHGSIQLTFASHVSGSYAVVGEHQPHRPSQEKQGSDYEPQELLAQMGPFRDVYWTFQGDRVEPEQVAKFYFIEFIRATRDQRSRSDQQALLQQVKAFLEEKGLDL